MGFINTVAARVREIFLSDKEHAATQLQRGQQTQDTGVPGSDILTNYGYESLSQYLRLETDLLGRYNDYEAMEEVPEIATALECYADDATQPDMERRRTVWVTAKDENIEEILDYHLFKKQLRLDEDSWDIARSLCLYGNEFEEVLVNEQGVIGLKHLPAATMRRIEGRKNELIGFVQDFKGRTGITPEEWQYHMAVRRGEIVPPREASTPQLGTAFEDWEVIHFRLKGKRRQSAYGWSVLESARYIWKRLMLLEDSALLYRLQRTAERYAFYIDVGNLPPAQAMAHVNYVRSQYRKKRYINPQTNTIDLRYENLTPMDDIFVPSRAGSDSTRIDVLSSPNWQAMDDIGYFLNKLFAALKVPKAYLAQEGEVARAILSSQDVRFARSVMRVQRELMNGYSKICRIHLAALDIDPFAPEFEVGMTVPSAIFELAQMEVRNAKADLATRMKEVVSLHWILSHVFGMDDETIEVIFKERSEDAEREGLAQAQAEIQSQKATGGMGGGGGGGFSGVPQGGVPTESILPSGRVITRHRFTDRDLQPGRASDERRAALKLHELAKTDPILLARLNETRSLLLDMKDTLRRTSARRA